MHHQSNGEKVIRSNIVQIIATYIIGISCLGFGAWQIIRAWGNTSNSLLPTIAIIGIGLYLLGDALMAVDEIILKPEKIIIVGNFSEKELTHKQIRDITLSSMRQYRTGFRSKIVKLVVIHPVSGGSISLTRRLGRPELLHETLMNWWEGPISPEQKKPLFSEYKESGESKSMLHDAEPSTISHYINTWDQENKNQESNIPNILIPANEKVLDYLKSVNVFHAMITPYSYDKVNDNRVHSDYSGVFIDKASSLPQNCKYVVYGFPALVHPETGVIFGFAMGMGNSYRLPEKIAEELQAHRDMELSRVRRKKVKKTSSDDFMANYSPPPLESNWWLNGMSFTGNLLRKCYEYYGRGQYNGAGIHLNVNEDLEKTPPPPPFYEAWLDRVFFLLIIVVGLLIVVFINYAMDNFKISDVIDLFKNR
jgi:hypothetical protein